METNPEFHPDENADLEDFDAFWSSQDTRRRRGVKIRGKWYELPKALPLQFELEARKLRRSKRDRDVAKLVGILLGQDAYEQMAADGLDIDEFRVLLAWAPRRVSGENVTLAEVAAEVLAADDDSEDEDGKPDPS